MKFSLVSRNKFAHATIVAPLESLFCFLFFSKKMAKTDPKNVLEMKALQTTKYFCVISFTVLN
jgi:hypothetical protein